MRTLACLLGFSALALPVQADLFTVSPGESIQAAVNAALVAGGDNEVRVRAGHYVGQVYVGPAESGTLTLSGGWLPGFTLRSGPEATVLDGGGGGPVVRVLARGDADVILANFSITGSTSPDGAVWVTASEHGEIQVRDNVVRDNHGVGTGSALWSAGIRGEVDSEARLDISGNQISGNTAIVPTGVAGAGAVGAALLVSGHGYANVASNRIRENWGNRIGGLAFIYVGRADVVDNVLQWNGLLAEVFHSALYIIALPDQHVVARRNTLTHNNAKAQVRLDVWAGSIIFSDSLVAAGPYDGIDAEELCDGIHFTNLTVTANAGVGLGTQECSSSPSMANSIVFGNGTEVNGGVAAIHSLFGDPEFVDRDGENYRLAESSGAINRGVNPPPEGELGPLDLLKRPRVQGWAVDLGAYETPVGEPARCRVLDWQDGFQDWPIPPGTIACRCVGEAGLTEFNCGFMLPDIFLSLHGPLAWAPQEPVGLEWTIDPWTDVAGSYAMSAEVRIDGKWVPQEWLGPTAPSLKQGTLVVEAFKVQLPTQGRGELRTQLKYTRAGAPNASVLDLEVMLPEPGDKP